MVEVEDDTARGTHSGLTNLKHFRSFKFPTNVIPYHNYIKVRSTSCVTCEMFMPFNSFSILLRSLEALNHMLEGIPKSLENVKTSLRIFTDHQGGKTCTRSFKIFSMLNQ